jgi:methionine-rich copper-binding protein CopC
MRHNTGILVVGCALWLAAGAMTHAPFSLVFAEPAAGGVFSEAPTRIRLIFSERLDPSKGEISLVAGDGRTIRVTAAADPHLADAIVARVPALPPGAYHVEWRVVSAGGLSLSGNYAFTFGPAASLPPSADSANAGALGQRLTRTEFSPPVRLGIELLLALALVALIWARQRSRRTRQE